MIVFAIEHCNGEIIDVPFLVNTFDDLHKLFIEGYLLYKINLFNGTISEIKKL